VIHPVFNHAMPFGVVVMLAFAAGPAFAQPNAGFAPRVAMVVGNSNYQSVDPLPNPANDARIIAEKLWESGFEVIETIDADREEMLADLATFRSRLHEGSEALFFYAGHGVQINGKNYLIPISAAPLSVDDLIAQSVDAQLFVDLMSNSGAKLNLVLLDACRNNPFAEITEADAKSLETRAISIGASEDEVARGLKELAGSSTGGLAEMTSGKTETIISFATAPGAVAYDGTGKHSPYTQAIADNIDESGLEVTDLFRRVRGDVREATDGNQIAWTTSTLESRFYFKPEGDDLVRTTTGMGVRSDTLGDLPPQRIVDRTIWRSIRDSGRIDAYKAYLRILPDGAFTEDAAQEIRNLGGTLDDVNPIDPLLQDIRSGATARVGATDREEFVSELDRGDVAVAIGTGLVWTPAEVNEAGWFYVEEAPRLGQVNVGEGEPLTRNIVRWIPEARTLSYTPKIGSNGGIDQFVGAALRDNGEMLETRVAIETYVDACDILAGNPYDSQRVTAGTRQFIIDRNFDAAIAVCEIAVDTNPDVVRFWAQLARAYRSAGRYDQALFYQQKAVDAGYASAMVYLGQMYLDAQAVPQDYARAKVLFEAAAERGETAAFTALAWIYRAGVGVEQDFARAMEYYREGAARGNDWAMTNIAEFYQEGIGVDQDITEAIRWYITAAKSGELTAQTRLARIYQTGDGVEPDYEQARFWFETAAGRGVPNAVTRLGIMYEEGQGQANGIEAAARLYRRAAQDGDAEAYFRLGRLYASKHPLFDDPARAVGLLERALSENVYGAERELARLYEDGRGVPKDLARARDLYAVAADGNPWAARDAGRAWASSDGVEPDYEQAVRWYRRAAEGGVPWAALDLAKLTEAGRGVEQDRIAALIWYATAQGLSDDPNLARLVTEAVASYAPDDYNFAAQRLLVGMGEDIGEPDGQIGPQTRTALDSVFASRGKSPPGDVITLEVLADLSTFN
jgi:TPR repeat protein